MRIVAQAVFAILSVVSFAIPAAAQFVYVHTNNVPLCQEVTMRTAGWHIGNGSNYTQTQLTNFTISGSSDFSLPTPGTILDDCNGKTLKVPGGQNNCWIYVKFRPTVAGTQYATVSGETTGEYQQGTQPPHPIAWTATVAVTATGSSSSSACPAVDYEISDFKIM